MEPKFQSSFIPKGPIASSSNPKSAPTKSKGIFNLIAVALFAVSVAGSLAVVSYNFYLKYRISKMGDDIEAARSDIQPEVIEEITRLEARLDSTSVLLKNHIAISPLFEFLEDSTVANVRFTDLQFDTTEGGLELRLDGQARGYSAVALQSNLINESDNFEKPVFSDLRLDKEGNVNFSFFAYIKPELLSYSRVISASPVPTIPVVPVSTSTPSNLLPRASSTPASASTSEASLIN